MIIIFWNLKNRLHKKNLASHVNVVTQAPQGSALNPILFMKCVENTEKVERIQRQKDCSFQACKKETSDKLIII